MNKNIPRGLYLITPDWQNTQRLIDVTQEALEGGAVCVQYRNKTASKQLKQEQIEQLLLLCQQTKIPLIINDDIKAARTYASGVHIGRDDGDFIKLCQHKEPNFIVGISCYNEFHRAKAAVEAGADYVAFGAMFNSPTKPDAVIASTDLIHQAKSELNTSVVCIGGITIDNAEQLIRAGADFLAVITDIYCAPNPGLKAMQFAQLFR